MNFAPYQDSSPESTRAPVTPSPATFPLPSPDTFENEPHHAGPSSSNTDTGTGFGTGSSTGFGIQRQSIDAYATSLPLRLDILACLAYVALPPAGGALLLLLERRSDYVRFHAWQGSLVFGFLFLVHLIVSFSKVLSWMLFVGDLLVIAWAAGRAFRDADTLERFELPFFGRLASSFVDEE